MKSESLLQPLPNDAQLWIYAADRDLTSAEEADLLGRLQPFLRGWQSHARPVSAAATVCYGRFLVMGGYLPADRISGCGVDAMTSEVKELAASMGLDWMPALTVFYSADGQVRGVSRPEFRRLVAMGGIDGDTLVYDLTLSTVEALRAGKLEVRAADAWHATVFRIPAVPA